MNRAQRKMREMREALRRFAERPRVLGPAARPLRPSESAHVWDERVHDGHDDTELAALRAELDRELDRLTRPGEES